MAFESLSKADLWIGLAINGIITGFAVAIGNYLAQKHFIERLRKLLRAVLKI